MQASQFLSFFFYSMDTCRPAVDTRPLVDTASSCIPHFQYRIFLKYSLIYRRRKHLFKLTIASGVSLYRRILSKRKMLVTKTGILGRVQLQPVGRQPAGGPSLLPLRNRYLLRSRSTGKVVSAGKSSAASIPLSSTANISLGGSLKQSVDVANCSHISWDEELLVSGDAVHPILREGRRLIALQRQLAASQGLSEKVVEGPDRSHPAEPAQQLTLRCVVQVTILRSTDRVQAFLADPG